MALCAIVIGCFGALLIAEGILRIAGIGMPALYEPDTYCGSRLRPNTRGVWNKEGHGTIRVNSLGFRGPEFSEDKLPNTIRIAVLGDSFVEALQVNEEDTFCVQLGKILNSNTKEGAARYEVINCGVSGYGTAQELQMLHHHVLPLHPDIVMLAVFPENDVRNNLRLLEGDTARPYFNLDRNGHLALDSEFRTSEPFVVASSSYERNKATLLNRCRVLQLLNYTKQNLQQRGNGSQTPTSFEEALIKSVAESIYTYSDSMQAEHKTAWEITERLILEIDAKCKEQEIPLFVFTVSSPIQACPDQKLKKQVLSKCSVDDLFYSEVRIESVCADAGIRFFPLASRVSVTAEVSGHYFHGFRNVGLGIGHWNEEGHQFAANEIAEVLMRSRYEDE